MNRRQAQQIIDLGTPMYDGMRWPGNGYPPNPGEAYAPLTPWARLCRNGAIGKRSVLLYNAGTTEEQQMKGVDMLNVCGDDADACPLILTLGEPQIIALPFSNVSDLAISIQNRTAEQNNAEMQDRGDFPGTADPAAWPTLQAIIEWGTGGTTARAAVDYINGCTVNLTASFVRVYAKAVTPIRGGLAGTSAAYVLRAFVSPGFTKPGNAQRTVYVGDVDAAEESDVFPIPRFAAGAYLVGASDDAAPQITVGTIRFWQSADGTNNVGNVLVTANQPRPFPIPNGAQYFSVLSGMGATALCSVVFPLSI